MYDCIQEEIDIWSQLLHPNIVKALNWFENKNQDKMYLMMQLADLGALAEATEENPFEFHLNQAVYAFV